MKHIITYYTQHGDLCHVWVEAINETEAKLVARRENWDIDKIVEVRRHIE